MALQTGSVIAKFKSDLSDLKSGVGEAKTMMGGLKSSASKFGEELKDSFGGFMNGVKIASAVGATAFTFFAKSAIDLKSETDKANISLGIMSERFGQNSTKAKALADMLGKDLRIGTGAASEGLQNLIKSGLTLDQSADLLKRFTNEAITGKSESISLADAVKNLTFAYATNNSALGNMSGISENWSNITEKGKTILQGWNGTANESAGISKALAGQIKAYEDSLKKSGKTLSASDDEMAKYVGLLQLTNLTMGSSEKFQGTYTDNVAKMNLKIIELKLALGTLLQNALNPLVQWFTNSGIIDRMTGFIEMLGKLGTAIVGLFQGKDTTAQIQSLMQAFTGADPATAKAIADAIAWFVVQLKLLGDWIIANKELVITFLQGLAIALGSLIIIGTIIGLLNMLFNPITLIILLVAALFTAWKTNFLGIRDLVDGVVTFLEGLFKNFANWFKENQDWIMQIAKGTWDIITGIFKLAFSIIGGALKVFGQLLMGDWKGALETVKQTAQNVWDAVKQIIGGVLDVIIGNIKRFAGDMIGQLEALWNKVKEIAGKIKDALSQISPFHKSSPSLVEYVQMGTGIIENTYRSLADSINGIDFKSGLMSLTGADLAKNLAGAGNSGNTTSVQQNITMNVQDRTDAEFINDRLAFMYRNSNL